MAKGIFVTGTGTDVGKTYVTALNREKSCRMQEFMQAIIRLHYQVQSP